jgi:hypothetical protein
METFKPKNPTKSSSVILKTLQSINPHKLGVTRKIVPGAEKTKMPKLASLIGAVLKKGLKNSVTSPGFILPVATNLATGKPGEAIKSGLKNFQIADGISAGDIGDNYKSKTIRDKYRSRDIKIDYKKQKNQIPKEEE